MIANDFKKCQMMATTSVVSTSPSTSSRFHSISRQQMHMGSDLGLPPRGSGPRKGIEAWTLRPPKHILVFARVHASGLGIEIQPPIK